MKSVLFSTNVGLSFLFFRGKWCCIYSVFLSQLVTSSHLSAAPSCLVRPGEWQGPHGHGDRGWRCPRVLHLTVQARPHQECFWKSPKSVLRRGEQSLHRHWGWLGEGELVSDPSLHNPIHCLAVHGGILAIACHNIVRCDIRSKTS